jgi:hypothetical protein
MPFIKPRNVAQNFVQFFPTCVAEITIKYNIFHAKQLFACSANELQQTCYYIGL